MSVGPSLDSEGKQKKSKKAKVVDDGSGLSSSKQSRSTETAESSSGLPVALTRKKDRKRKVVDDAVMEVVNEVAEGGTPEQPTVTKKRKGKEIEAVVSEVVDTGGEKKEKRAKRHRSKDVDAGPHAAEGDKHGQEPAGELTEKVHKKKRKKTSGEDENPEVPLDASTEGKQKLNRDTEGNNLPPKKKKKKPTRACLNPQDDASLSDQARKALAYAYGQFADPGKWKFNKARQNWLIRNMWSDQAIPDAHFILVQEYLSKVQGGVRDNLVKACQLAALPPVPSSQPDATSKDESAGEVLLKEHTPTGFVKRARALELLERLGGT